ncbi:MAG: glycosyltransferase family 4 protein [Candidatus Paceibacteria bacterium]
MKKLKIAVLASNFIRIPPRPKDVPPQHSGAPERMVSLITEGLISRGHQVTLFASGDSRTKGKLISVTKRAAATDPEIGFSPSKPHVPYEYLLISKAYQMAKQGYFDIIHSHLDFPAAYFAPLVKTPTVSTLHSPLLGARKEILSRFKNSQYYISISNAQRKPLPDLQYIATIYHGLEIQKIPFGKTPKNYLAFSARIHPSKGVKEAIWLARKLNLKLIIMGSRGDDEYWQKQIRPQIDNEQIIYKGFLAQGQMYEIIKQAKAYVLPLQWEEPFGLTLVEAMACGTPVFTLDRGSAKEVVKQGKTGFVVENMTQMAKAFKKIDQMKRQDCRKWAEERFSVERMVLDYEKAFYKIIQKES